MTITFEELLNGLTELNTELQAQTQRANQLELIRQQHDAQIADLNNKIATLTDPRVESVIAEAKLLMNMKIPYVFGAEWENDKAFDCSSFTQKIFKIVGIVLPRTSKDQATHGTSIPVGQQKRGDCLFFDYNGDGVIDHVGTYLGDGTMIHTNTPTTGINVKAIGTPKIVRRFI